MGHSFLQFHVPYVPSTLGVQIRQCRVLGALHNIGSFSVRWSSERSHKRNVLWMTRHNRGTFKNDKSRLSRQQYGTQTGSSSQIDLRVDELGQNRTPSSDCNNFFPYWLENIIIILVHSSYYHDCTWCDRLCLILHSSPSSDENATTAQHSTGRA